MHSDSHPKAGIKHQLFPRGIKRPASTEADTSSKVISPMAPSEQTFRWPISKPLHTAQIQGTGTDVRSISFNSDGSQFAVCCKSCLRCLIKSKLSDFAGNDSSVRIWNNMSQLEVAKLAHVAPVISVAWMDGDS